MRFLNVALFFLPFAVFFAWAFLENRKRLAAGPDASKVRTPWFYLFAAGLALFAAGFVVTWALEDRNPDCEYVPARMQDGKLVDGECLPKAGS